MNGPYLPKAFEAKMKIVLKDDFGDFWKSCQVKSPRTVRANSFKISASELQKIFTEHKIESQAHPAIPNVLTVKTPFVRIGLMDEHRRGLFVVQDVSSMIPPLVLNPKPGEAVLDMAAAPGMKTCEMAELMQNQGAIVALDSNRERLKGLRFNLNRIGIVNTLVVLGRAESFRPRFLFDKVLLDAPCSSEGVVRKRWDALKNWSQNLVLRKAELQKKLVLSAFDALKDGGELVYSTCTFSPEENEEVIQFLLSKHSNAQIEKIEPIKNFIWHEGLESYGSKEFDSAMKNCVRVLPQDNDSESFFVAKIKKNPWRKNP
ncbi:MAG: RsmB/NOP family class I SAM-dependent RNA methyltransferase [Candidatus Micrarchaeota archaeon]